MSRAADDKAIDKDIDDLGLFMAGVQGGLAAEERQSNADLEELTKDASPSTVDLYESNYQDALRNEKETIDAYKILQRLQAEIKRLRKEGYSVLLSSLCLDIQTATGIHSSVLTQGHSSKDCAKLISDGIKGLAKEAGKASVARRMLVMLATLQDVRAFDRCGRLGKRWSKQVTEWIEEARGPSPEECGDLVPDDEARRIQEDEAGA